VWAFISHTVLSQTINKAEYFIDTDPGAGNGQNVTFTSSISLNDISFQVPIPSLTDGFHYLFFRVRDSNNKWSSTEFRTIFKSSLPSSGSLTDVIGAEYFIDIDPGINAGTNIPITSGNILEPYTFEIPVTSLSNGFHYLFTRVKDANGKWSPAEQRIFLKETLSALPPIPNITRVEYYIDSDPGFGNAAAVPFTPAASLHDQVFILDLSSLSQGSHKLFIRAKDANNVWSLVHVETISMCNFPGTVLNTATTISTGSITATWAPVSGATGYRLDVSKDNFATFVSGYNNKTITGTSEVINSLTSGTSYQMRVRAAGTCVSINSNLITATTLLPAPILNGATEVTSSSFKITWSAVAAATGYRLDVSKDNFATFVSGYENKPISTTSETVIGLLGATTYQYRVRSENAVSLSLNSSALSMTTRPAPPVAMAAETVTNTQFIAKWNASNGASSYRLSVSADQFQTFVTGYNNKQVSTTSEIVTGLTSGMTYQYKVSAVNSSGTSEYSNIIELTTALKAGQVITFNALLDRTLDNSSFTLIATSNSGLPVRYTSPSDKISISGNTVSLLKAGRTTIKANQEGNENFNAATEVERSFCIKPAKPIITIENSNTETPTLKSNSVSGNQWYSNGTAISGATNSSLLVSNPGVYTLQVTADDCFSETSNPYSIIVTAVEDSSSNLILLYPNPADETVHLDLSAYLTDRVTITISGYNSSLLLVKQVPGGSTIDIPIQDLSPGIYHIRVQQNKISTTLKLVKK